MKKKILIIDDDAGIIEVLTIILEGEGYEVKSVDDDSVVFETIRQFRPDLILLDIWMPGLGGKEICRRIRNEEEIKMTKVLFVSASVSIEQVASDCDADGFIEKPFEMTTLLEKVAKQINT